MILECSVFPKAVLELVVQGPPFVLCFSSLFFCNSFFSQNPVIFTIIPFSPTPVNEKNHQQVGIIKGNKPVVMCSSKPIKTKISTNCLFTDSDNDNYQVNLRKISNWHPLSFMIRIGLWLEWYLGLECGSLYQYNGG